MSSKLISANSLLGGLPADAVFPFIDTTPNTITRAHIAITDTTIDCTGGTSAPSNVQVFVGVTGGTPTNVMTAATHTKIGTNAQCVFHVTITPGVGGVRAPVTDVVVVNAGSSSLTGINTVTATATVRVS